MTLSNVATRTIDRSNAQGYRRSAAIDILRWPSDALALLDLEHDVVLAAPAGFGATACSKGKKNRPAIRAALVLRVGALKTV
jgi:hypothetical protein